MSAAGDGLQGYCKACASARYYELRPAPEPMPCHVCGTVFDPKKRSRSTTCSHKCSARKTALRKKYGITPDDYWAQLQQQGLGCAICTTQEWGGHGPNVDHDHATGELRGILCAGCNRGLGSFCDDVAAMRAAADYVAAGGVWKKEK